MNIDVDNVHVCDESPYVLLDGNNRILYDPQLGPDAYGLLDIAEKEYEQFYEMWRNGNKR